MTDDGLAAYYRCMGHAFIKFFSKTVSAAYVRNFVAVFVCLGVWLVAAPALGETNKGSSSPQDAASPVVKGTMKPRIPGHDAETAKLLDQFYNRLASAKDAESAGLLENAIEMMWHRSGSDTVDLLMSRSLTAVKEDNTELALQILDSVTEMAPDFTEGWNRKAFVHFSQKQYGEALKDLRRVLALDPRHFKALDGLANILRELGDKKRALQIYRTLIKVHPYWAGAKETMDELRREVEGQNI